MSFRYKVWLQTPRCGLRSTLSILAWTTLYTCVVAIKQGKKQAQSKDDSPVNAASNPGGYMLLIPGKRLHITALNEHKKFRDMGNKQGAVETITALEKDGLGLIISNRTQGTAKVCDLQSVIPFHFPCFINFNLTQACCCDIEVILYVPSLQQYTFVKCDVEGAEAEVAAKLARYGVSLRQYKKSLMEEELLPTRIKYKVSLEMLLSVERIVFTYMKTGLSWTYFTSSSSATGTQHKGSHQPL